MVTHHGHLNEKFQETAHSQFLQWEKNKVLGTYVWLTATIVWLKRWNESEWQLRLSRFWFLCFTGELAFQTCIFLSDLYNGFSNTPSVKTKAFQKNNKYKYKSY